MVMSRPVKIFLAETQRREDAEKRLLCSFFSTRLCAFARVISKIYNNLLRADYDLQSLTDQRGFFSVP